MILLATFTAILGFTLYFDMPTKMTNLSSHFHHFCLRSLPGDIENLASLETLVCGKNMQDMELQSLLVHTSLIHIFIVSGSHLLLLHKIMAKIFGRNLWILIPLCIYVLATLCQPPSLRSLLFLGLTEVALRKRLFLTPLVAVFLSGLLSVAIFPQWLHSRSLLMSLAAALAITAGGELLKERTTPLTNLLFSQCILYFVMGFCLWGISNLHPLSILFNVVLGPMIGGVLFPLGLLILIFPFLSPLFDGCLNTLFWILRHSHEVIRQESTTDPLSLVVQWIFFFIIFFGTYHWTIHLKRRTYET